MTDKDEMQEIESNKCDHEYYPVIEHSLNWRYPRHKDNKYIASWDGKFFQCKKCRDVKESDKIAERLNND